jgi:hypothetical protein
MVGVLGDVVKSDKAGSTIKHFVTPKKSPALNQDYIIFKATGVTAAEITDGGADQIAEWVGGEEVSGDPLKRRVARDSTGKTELKIRKSQGGVVASQMNVWVVWSTISSGPVNLDNDNSNPARIKLTWGYNFAHTIAPGEIASATVEEKPYLRDNTSGPQGQGPCGEPLSAGADTRWDGSRNRRVMVIPAINDCHFGPFDYPSNFIGGNDDKSTQDDNENNDPYTNNSILTGGDRPAFIQFHNEGSVGDRVEARAHFQEFTRLKIGNNWYAISNPYLWRVHFKFIKIQSSTGEVWVNNGSIQELNNAGYTTP